MKETGLLPSRFTFYRGKDRKQSEAWGEPQRKAGYGWRVLEVGAERASPGKVSPRRCRWSRDLQE